MPGVIFICISYWVKGCRCISITDKVKDCSRASGQGKGSGPWHVLRLAMSHSLLP